MKEEEKEIAAANETTADFAAIIVEEKPEDAMPMILDVIEVKEVNEYLDLHPIERTFMKVQDNPIQDVKVTSDFESSKTEWNFDISGPENSDYKGGIFKVKLHTVGFPERPPMCQFKTKIWHPQVREDGFGRFWVEI